MKNMRKKTLKKNSELLLSNGGSKAVLEKEESPLRAC